MKKILKLGSSLGWIAVVGIVAFQLLIPSEVLATNYYFSTIRGNDGNSGTSPGSPWATISKMQSTVNSLKAGDVIYLERGSVWYKAELDFQYRKGTSSNPIRIRPYGEGPMPILSGEKVLTGGVKSGNIYTFHDADIPGVYLTSQSYGRRYLGSVSIGGKCYPTARYPNTGEYLLSTAASSTTVTGDQSWSTNQWQGGFVAVKNVNWQWSSAYIYSNTSNVLTTSPHVTSGSIGNPGGTKYYYILNAYNAMDVTGEWASKEDEISIYWPGSIGEVKVSVVDTIINMFECDYVQFDSLDIRGANFIGAMVRQGDYNKFNHCRFSGIGEYGVYMYGTLQVPDDPGDTEGGEVTNCEFADVLHSSVLFRFCRGGLVKGNYIHRNALHNGYHNLVQETIETPVNGYSIAVFNNLMYSPRVLRNYIDSTAAGIITHYNRYNIYIRENYISNYGLTEMSDIAAFYLVSDTYSSAIKSYKRNIMVNGHAPKATIMHPYTDNYTHAVYFDADSYSVKGDSNTIHTTCAALCTNGGKYRSFKYNNIMNPNAYAMHPAHGNAIYHSYNWPMSNGYASHDTIYGNNMVFGAVSTRGYSFWRQQAVYGSHMPLYGRMDNNHYFDPLNTSPTIAIIYDQYSPDGTYNMEQWKAATFTSGDFYTNPGANSTYNNTAYAAVKFFKNFSDEDKSFPLKAKYVDVDGNPVEGSVIVPAFYSVLLFRVEGDASLDSELYIDTTLVPALAKNGIQVEEPSNRAPAVFDAQYTVNESDNVPLTIGTIVATDPDAGQSLSFTIASGNSSGLFAINNQGVLSFTTSAINFTGDPLYTLTIRVQDNGAPALTDQATVTVKLVAQEEQTVQNFAPEAEEQTFLTSFDEELYTVIGTVEASDPDDGQTLSYTISAGNSEGLFTIDESSGAIALVELPANPVPATYKLIVNISDDAADPLVTEVAITIYISASDLIYYIDPTNEGDALADGSYEHPFSSWSEVEWKENASYLQKKGTVSNEEKILITASGVTLGDYGSGAKPIINSTSDDYAIKAIDKENVTVKNLKVNADMAIGCVYFIGASCKNNAIENCELIGADYGLRMIDGSSYIVKYNVFMCDVDGIYSIAKDAEIYYNVFKGNHKAINLSSYSSNARIYNNVFYDNRQGISASYAEVTLFNNIFYLAGAGDQAINHKLDKLVSNNNMFYPEQSGFIEIEDVQYNSLEEYQDYLGLDLNSFAKDPLFVDVYTNNFSVAGESKAIDAGRLVGLTQDFSGREVPYGGGPDIGMIEASTEAIITSVSFFDKEDGEKLLSVYPNPSQGRFSLEYECKTAAATELMIHSLNGKQVFYDVIDVGGRFVTEIDLSDMPKGMYYVTAKTENEVMTQKVIIQ
ncbi:MAG: cadherin domain-containing protein [Bacteroidales bacterium]|nr:cadherin domain-containing protein [Bacteroidales bacterium]